MELPLSLSTPLYQAPRLIIERQPKKRGYRFRYKSEGETHGGIPGESDPNSGSKKFYPTVKILGYTGPAKVVVTLVTANNPYHLHAHSMIVNREPMKGYCIFEMNGSSNTLELKNIAIQHAVKERLMDTLMDRILQNSFISRFGWNSALKPGEKMLHDVEYYTKILEDKDESNTFVDRTTAKAIAGAELKELQRKAKQLSKTMAMNSCRLCFQAFLMSADGKYTQVLDSVVSDEIIDGKTKEGATLKIVRLSAVSSSVGGGDEVWLLADKLNADDVEVRFFKSDASGNCEWEGYGEFAKSDVFKQAVLIFRTPAYKDLNIRQPVKVCLQLRRKRDKTCTSDPTPFTYKPKRYDRYNLHEKRKKEIPKNLLEGSFPKKSAIDFNFQMSNMGSNLMHIINQRNQGNHGSLLASNQGNMLVENHDSSLATNQGNRVKLLATNHGNSPAMNHEPNQFHAPFMMGNNSSLAGSTLQSPIQVNDSVAPLATAPSTLSSTATALNLDDTLDNLTDLTDSFMNQILGADIKVEPVTDDPCHDNNDMYHHSNNGDMLINPSTVNSFLQNFSNDLGNFDGGQNTLWGQHVSGFDIKKMEE